MNSVGLIKLENSHLGHQFSPNMEVRTNGQGENFFHRVNPNRCFLISSTTMKPKRSMNSQLCTYIARYKVSGALQGHITIEIKNKSKAGLISIEAGWELPLLT